MNADLRVAAKAIIRAEPEIARYFSEPQLEELVSILAKRLRIAAAMVAKED